MQSGKSIQNKILHWQPRMRSEKARFSLKLKANLIFFAVNRQSSRCSNATVGDFQQSQRESYCTNEQVMIKTRPCGAQRQGGHAKMGWVKHGGEYHLYYWGGSWA